MHNVKTISGFEDKYAVTQDGAIWSYVNNRFLTPRVHSHGYRSIALGRGNERLIHRLVAETFLPNPGNLPQVNHINGDKADNRLENLEWVNNSQNLYHSVKIGTYNRQRKLSDAYLKKVSRVDIEKIKSMREKGHTLTAIGEKIGISHSMVSRYCRGLYQQEISHA